jgi:hypothetical protein
VHPGNHPASVAGLARREDLSTDRLALTSFIWQCY